MADIEIGAGKPARRAYGLDEISVVPSRRTRAPEDVDLSWQLDAYRLELPVMSSPDDSVTSPATAGALSSLGALAVLDLEGLWTRHEDPAPLLEGLPDELRRLEPAAATERLRSLYESPVRPDLVVERVRQLAASGAVSCGAVSPKHAEQLAPHLLAAELDVLVIRGIVVSAEHVARGGEPLNLKRFIRELDLPVVVGGCTSYQSALHLMRTGAVGILVGAGGAGGGLGIGVPQATAIADAAGARSRHLEETGVYVQVIADGGIHSSRHLVRAIACGADAVMLSDLLARAGEAPARGLYFGAASHHATLPRAPIAGVSCCGSLQEILTGPAGDDSGHTNLAGALRKAMATCGYATVREFHKADVVVTEPSPVDRS